MSIIDSGLGWTCDSDFYVDDTTTKVGSDNPQNSYYKTTAGASIVGAYTTNYNTEAFAILSTSSNFTTLSVQSALTHSTVVNGITWYITTPLYGNGTVKATDFPYYTNTQIDVEFYEDPASLNAVVTMFLTAANVQMTTPQLPDLSLVENIIKENNKRIISGGKADNYSTNEQAIGTWIDGSILYQKTFVVTGLANKQWNNNVLGTSGINIIDAPSGTIHWLYNNTQNIATSLSYYRAGTEFVTTCINATADDINILPNISDGGFTVDKAVITIRYTKPSSQTNP